MGSGSPDSEGHGRAQDVSPPTKLDRLKFQGFSAEFLDRVTEPNGNIPDKYSLGRENTLIVAHFKFTFVQIMTSSTNSSFDELLMDRL